MTTLRVGSRIVNAQAISSIRKNEYGVAVWLIGEREPLQARGMEADTIQRYFQAVMYA